MWIAAIGIAHDIPERTFQHGAAFDGVVKADTVIAMESQRRHWEYKILDVETSGFFMVEFDAATAEKRLNELGRDGWELVAISNINARGGRSLSAVMVFKRPSG